MVYLGPSQGCQICRKRRVKCDGGRPGCRNCLKRKQICPGYKDRFDLMLKDETALVIERVGKKKPLYDERRGNEIERQDQISPFSCSLSPDAELYSLCFFFSNYIAIPRDQNTTAGFMEYLMPLYSKVGPESPLSLATSAVAINLTSMWAQQGTDTPDARRLYTKAVIMTKAALSDEKQNKTDELLLAVLVLDFYDTLSRRFSNQANIGTHRDGTIALVKYRGPANYQSEVSKGLLIAVRNRLVAGAIQMKRPIRFDPDVWADVVAMPHNATTKLDILGFEFANLQALSSSLLSPKSRATNPRSTSVASEDSSDTSSLLETLLAQALDLERRLYAWLESIPESWDPVSVPLKDIHPSIQAAGFYGSQCDVYSSLQAASIYNIWRCTTISLLRVIEQLRLAILPGSIVALSIPGNYAATRTQALVDEICASVPYHLGNRISPSMPELYEGMEYPQPPTSPDGTTRKHFGNDVEGNIVEMSQIDHMRVAASSGGWFILNSFLPILWAARPATGTGNENPPPLILRPGQMQWILGQLKRVQNLYLIPTPRLSLQHRVPLRP